MTPPANAAYGLAELKKEQTLGGIGETKARDVPCIDVSGFDKRKPEVAEQLWNASTEIGFFQLVNHGIPQEQIDEAFAMTERFFALPHDIKAHYPLGKGTNAGWEYKSQVRPSTGTADPKNPTRSPCRGCRDCGRPETNCRASKRRCSRSSAPTGRWP